MLDMNDLKDNDVEIMEWSPESPDMNPIENSGKIPAQNVTTRNLRNAEDLGIKLH